MEAEYRTTKYNNTCNICGKKAKLNTILACEECINKKEKEKQWKQNT